MEKIEKLEISTKIKLFTSWDGTKIEMLDEVENFYED